MLAIEDDGFVVGAGSGSVKIKRVHGDVWRAVAFTGIDMSREDPASPHPSSIEASGGVELQVGDFAQVRDTG